MTTPPTITPDEIDEIWCDGEPGTGITTAGPWTYLATQQLAQARWHDRYWLVLRHDPTGEVWGLSYGIGLTENQDDDLPWEDVSVPIPMSHRLYPHEITRTAYRKTPQEA